MTLSDFESVISSLTEDEKTVMREISRIGKGKSGTFNEKQLSKRIPIIRKKIDVQRTLALLANKGFATPVKKSKHLWALTHYGKKIEHILEKKFQAELNPDLNKMV